MGAAAATVIGQVFTAVLAVWYLLNMKILRPASGDYALRWNTCRRLLALGITSFLSQVSLVASMAAVLHFCGKNKPWHEDYKNPFGMLYLHYMNLTERRQQSLRQSRKELPLT